MYAKTLEAGASAQDTGSERTGQRPEGACATTKEPEPQTGPSTPAPSLPVFLSTEHWSLLGTRSMTWSEVMSRITSHLTVVSAFLVVLALTAQATGFGTPFRVLSIGLASAALVMGVLTAIRVNIASHEDADLVRAMNRIRHADVDLVPELAPYLSASAHDDERGLMHTYALGRQRRTLLHVIGSTSFFIMTVNTLVAGTLAGLVGSTNGAAPSWTAIVGVLGGPAYAAADLEVGRRAFGGTLSDIRFPTAGRSEAAESEPADG